MKNIFYYDHRGTLEDSLTTKHEFNSFFELVCYIAYKYNSSIGDVNFHYYCLDNRVPCQTFIVCIKNNAVGWLREDL